MRFKSSYHPYAAVTVVCWSLAYVFTRLALTYFSALSLGFIRYFVASCVLVILCFATRLKLPSRRDLKWFLLAGGLGFFTYMYFFNKGTALVTASTSSIVIATSPVMTALLARLFFKERLFPVQWLATSVEFGGILILTLFNGAFTVNAGVIFVLLASAVFSGYNLLQRRLTKTYSALQASTFSIFSGTLMLAVFAPVSVREVQNAPYIQFFYVAVLGVFSSAVAYVTWAKAFSKAEKTSYVTNYTFITPVLTTILGYLIAGEVPNLPALAGGIITLSGAVLFHFGGRVSLGAAKRLPEP